MPNSRPLQFESLWPPITSLAGTARCGRGLPCRPPRKQRIPFVARFRPSWAIGAPERPPSAACGGPWSKTHNGQIDLNRYAPLFFYVLRFIRPSGTVICRFLESQEYLLGYNQPVPPGLSFVVFSNPRSTSWATINPSLRDCRLSFSRIPGVPPGLQSTRPSGTVICRFPASQEYLLGYNQPVPPGLSFVVFPHPRSTS